MIVELTLGATGSVSDAHVLSGPDELRKATLESVLQWHYANDAQLPTKTQVTIKFRMPQHVSPSIPIPAPEGTPSVKQIDMPVPDALKQKLQSHISLHEGDQITQDSLNDLIAAVRDVDEHLNVRVAQKRRHHDHARQWSRRRRIRVGGNVQQANLIQKVQPVYPLQAKQDRVQGKVQFTRADRERWPRPECGS